MKPTMLDCWPMQSGSSTLADMLRRLAEDYDQRAECIETGTPEIRHADLSDVS